MRREIIDLPLHYGKTPAWLFEKMKKLAREIIYIIVAEFGKEELLNKLVDPWWFQAFGCVLGFDWHSSGLTTVTCGAIKEGIKDIANELGVYIVGGKGVQARNTPFEIQKIADSGNIKADVNKLIYNSKIVAKVDTAALQDSYQLYHHNFIFTDTGKWGVIQQGMNEESGYARRYHWLGDKIEEFTNEPHLAIVSDRKQKNVLDMTASISKEARECCVFLSKERPDKVSSLLKKLQQSTCLPTHHQIMLSDINPQRFHTILLRTYQEQSDKFEQLLSIEGVGAKTIRALSLISELIYSTPVSNIDPARYSFAHGGKDGYPYPIDKDTYNNSIELLRKAIALAKINQGEKLAAIRTLANIGNYKS
jgi:hypothetical protein